MKIKALICLALISFPVHGQITVSGSLFREPEKVVKATIILPFNSKGTASDNFIDFYSGALLAARHLSTQGFILSLDVFDIRDEATPLYPSALETSDIIIGPVSITDIRKVLEILPEDKCIISPLEQKAEALVPDSRVIQVPTPVDVQSRDLARWMATDMKAGDKAVIVCDPASVGSSYYNILAEELDRMGVYATRLIYNAANDESNQPRFEAAASTEGTTRFLIASEKESFVNDIIRNVNLLNFKKFNVELYGQSRVRSYESIDIENLHRCRLNTVNRYFVDYKNSSVKRFVEDYRKFFLGEPSSFAFQGYDIMMHFVKARSIAGKEWSDIIRVADHGLQLDFLFSGNENGGAVNTAVRRVSYSPDYSIILR